MRIPTHPLMRQWRAALLSAAILLSTGCETTDASDLTGAALEAVDSNAAASDDPVGPKGPFAEKMKQLQEILGPLPEECKPPAKPELAEGDDAEGPPQGPPQGPPPSDGEDMGRGKPPIDGQDDADGAKKGPPPGSPFAVIACALPEEQELIDAAAEACKPPHPPKGKCPDGDMGEDGGPDGQKGPPPQGGQGGPGGHGGQMGPPPQGGQGGPGSKGGKDGPNGQGEDGATDQADKPTQEEMEAKHAACEAALDALIEAVSDWKAITPQD